MKDRLSLCVAMCTYNGARYLQEQLASIVEQTRPPERMIVVDDGSKDGTCELLEVFRRAAPFPVQIMVNDENLGYVKNFEKAVVLCAGNVIVLSDQDDVWLPQKLARLESAFIDQPGVDAFFSDATVVDAERRPYSYSLWQAMQFDAEERRRIAIGEAFEVLIRRNVVTGATLALRSTALARTLPFPEIWHHDEWIAMTVASTGTLGMITECLIEYRQHDSNQVGARRLGLRGRLRSLGKRSRFDAREIEKMRLLHDHLVRLSVSARRLSELDQKIEHARARAALPGARWRRIWSVLREWRRGRYSRYARGWKSAVGDLVERF